MLVLRRKVSEGIEISLGGKTVKIIVLEASGRQVKLGFDADTTIKIHRQEILHETDIPSPINKGSSK